MAVVGAGLAAAGLALASDFKGCATWHARQSVRSVRWLEGPLRHMPPWKQLLEAPHEGRVARQAVLARLLGVAFACVGVLLFIAAFVATAITTT
jgi:hypothetical protein